MKLADLFGRTSARLDPEPSDPKPVPLTALEQERVAFVRSRLKEAALARQRLEQRWAVSLAFEEGQQWVEWDSSRGTLRDLISPEERLKYRTYNYTRMLVTKNVARATMNRPSRTVVPFSESEFDQDAAEEADQALQHYDQRLDSQETLRRMVRFALVCTTAYLKQGWDPTRTAYVPAEYGPDGAPSRYVKAPVGDLYEEFVPGTDLFLDPRASTWSEVRWLIHARFRPVGWIKERWGVEVREEMIDNQALMFAGSSWLAGLLRAFNPAGSGPEPLRKVALVTEYYDAPSERYPKGRMIVTASDRVIHYAEELPCGLDTFPFEPLGYATSFSSTYHASMVEDLAPPQFDLNRALSSIWDRLEHDKMTVVIPRGAEIGADAFEEKRHYRKIYIEPGFDYQVQQNPPLNPEWIQMAQQALTIMQDLAGVHEVSQGGVPGGVTAGYAIRLAQEADQTQLSTFWGSIESFIARRDQKRLQILARYIKEPRAITVEKEEDDLPDGASRTSSQTIGFDAMRAGGLAVVSIVPGSGTPRTPEAQNQEALNLYQLGVMGPPQDPRSSILLLKMMKLAGADKLIDALQHEVEMNASAQLSGAAAQLSAVTGSNPNSMAPEPQQGVGGVAPAPGVSDPSAVDLQTAIQNSVPVQGLPEEAMTGG